MMNNSSEFISPETIPAEDSDDRNLSTHFKIFLVLIYTTIIILAVGGNVIVVYIVIAYQRMRTVTNYFIVNLALSDIIMSVMCIPFTFVSNIMLSYWPFGNFMCPIVLYLQAVAVFLSAFTLVAISVDRYIAIVYPLKPRLTGRESTFIIGLIWTLSIMVPLPSAVVSKIYVETRNLSFTGNESSINSTLDSRKICMEQWSSEQSQLIFTIIIMVLQYFLPLLVLIMTYARIAVIIWAKRIPGVADNTRDQRIAASKRKMVKMMITVVIIYALCWLPLHLITIMGDLDPSIWNYSFSFYIWVGSHWLAMSNSCYNPIIYCWMNHKYRNGFRYVLRYCACITFDEQLHGPYQNSRVHTAKTHIRASNRENHTVHSNMGNYNQRQIKENKETGKCVDSIALIGIKKTEETYMEPA